MLINYIFRAKLKGGFSIEELFKSISNLIKLDEQVSCFYLPFHSLSFKAIYHNFKSLKPIKGIVHITGDVHYIALYPFKKSVLTIHDVGSVLKGNFFKKIFLKLFWFWLPSLTVNKITVISEFTKKQLIKVIPWSKNKIEVVYNPVNPVFTRCDKAISKLDVKILHIGTKQNKNLLRTVKALETIDCTLLIVGKLTEEQELLLKETNIKFENYVGISISEINQLYKDADIISFISLYEGFGMPIIEGQSVGRPIITSKRGSIPEVALDSVLYVDPENISEIHLGFLKLIDNFDLREKLINSGFENVKRFQIEKIKNQYLKLYKTL